MSEIDIKLGQALQAEREARGLDLETLAEDLKISETNLIAIEKGDKSGLPSELYFNLFSKTYAEHLGIDLQATIEAIKEEMGMSLDNGRRSRPVESSDKGEIPAYEAPAEPDRSNLLPLGMAASVVAALVLAVYGLFYAPVGSDEEALPVDDDEPYAEVAAVMASYDWGNEQNAGKPAPLKLNLQAREESWATVLADGDTAIFRSLVPWRDYEVTANYRLLVSVGIPSRVKVSLNGQEVNLVDPESRRISRVEINQANFEDILNTPETEVKPASPVQQPEAATPKQSPGNAGTDDEDSSTATEEDTASGTD